MPIRPGPGGWRIGAMHYGNRKTYEVHTDEATFEAALVAGFGAVSQAMAGTRPRALSGASAIGKEDKVHARPIAGADILT